MGVIDIPGRADAIRRLVEIALGGKPKAIAFHRSIEETGERPSVRLRKAKGKRK
jgi:hypothetical protein